jgi:tellurium resistance protein TerD
MAINLQKGQTIDLRKNDKGDAYDLSRVTIGLGWDIRKKSGGGGGFFGKLLGGSKEADYDLDATAFLLDSSGKIANLGRTVSQNGHQVGLFESDIVFFNNPRHPTGHVWSTGDNRTGSGEGDDEQIIVMLDQLDARYDKIVFVVCIYNGKANNQHFGMVDNAFIRAVDAKGKEIARFNMSNDASFDGMCSMLFAEVYRKDGTWKFRALGDAKPMDNFIELVKIGNYLYA